MNNRVSFFVNGWCSNKLFPLDSGYHVTNINLCNMRLWLKFEEEKLCGQITFAFNINHEHPPGQIVGKGTFFGLNLKSYRTFDGHFLFPREILTDCCRWRCLTFSGCSDGFSICHCQGHRSHRTVMGRGCQNWSKMARHFPYYLTTAVRLQNKTKRMPCEIYTLCLKKSTNFS